MPRAPDGTFTLVTGNPVLPDTLIETTWANNTLGDVAQALTDSLSRNGNGGMLVPFEFADGSVSAPAITFANQPNSGIYRSSLNLLNMSIGAVDRTRWTADSVTPFEVFTGGIFKKVAHSTTSFDAQEVLANSFNYLAPVVAQGSELFYGINGRTNIELDASANLADTALQPLDNISELTNDSAYITDQEIPASTASLIGGFKHTITGTAPNLTLNLFTS